MHSHGQSGSSSPLIPSTSSSRSSSSNSAAEIHLNHHRRYESASSLRSEIATERSLFEARIRGQTLDFRDEALDTEKKDSSFSDRACNCMAGTAADCTAICCCPFTILHIFGLLFIRLPAAMCQRCFGRIKKNKNKQSQSLLRNKEDYDWTPILTPKASWREKFASSQQQGLGDENFWQLFEGQTGFWTHSAD